MSEHDYKAALAALKKTAPYNVWGTEAPEWKAVEHALLCMDKLMQEPSKGMCAIENDRYLIGNTFKAMRDQMFKEVSDNGQ